jgi:hypothetical protein
MFTGLGPTVLNYLKLFARISPMLLVFFLLSMSFFDNGIKGFVYLGCILFLSLLIHVISAMMGTTDSSFNTDIMCRVFDHPMGNNAYHTPAMNSAIIGFTLVYLLYPMVANNEYNYSVIVFVSTLFIVDTFMTLIYKCTNTFSIILGTAIGAVLSFIIVFVIIASGNESLLFFNEMKSNNVVCKRPSKQKFKCNAYKK